MRKIIALDFDGVLHPRCPSASSEMFKGVEVLAAAIAEVPDVSIVIDSTWRHHTSDMEWAIAQFPRSISSAIAGCTPNLGGKNTRELEIFEWLKINATTPFNLMILDDEPELFSKAMLDLIYCVNGELGLCHSDVHRIRERLLSYHQEFSSTLLNIK